MSGKKERQSLKDKARARRLKGLIPPKKKEEESEDTQARKRIMWQIRKEQGQAGMAGAGRAHKEPSGKTYSRKKKHKDREAALIFKVASRWLESNF